MIHNIIFSKINLYIYIYIYIETELCWAELFCSNLYILFIKIKNFNSLDSQKNMYSPLPLKKLF